jgi:hypothetical protein
MIYHDLSTKKYVNIVIFQFANREKSPRLGAVVTPTEKTQGTWRVFSHIRRAREDVFFWVNPS